MSLKWLLRKFINSDNFNSNEVEGASSSLENLIGSETEENHDAFEDSRTCPDDCEHENCPFQHQVISNSEIFGNVESIYTSSSVSLLRKISSESLMEFLSGNSFLKISRIFPLRDNSTIIHWSVKSFIGIRGYKILIDGIPASTVYSPYRTSAYISKIDMSLPHQFTVSIIPDTFALFPNKIYLLEPAFFSYNPL